MVWGNNLTEKKNFDRISKCNGMFGKDASHAEEFTGKADLNRLGF